MTRIKRVLSILLVICAVCVLLPVPTTAAGTVASGVCGDDLTWKLDSDGVLTISGNGPMYDFEDKSAPWFDYCFDVTAVKFGAGVTSVGKYAFQRFFSMSEITIPANIKSLGYMSFDYCGGLDHIYFEGDPPEFIAEILVGNCWYTGGVFFGVVADAHYPAGNPNWTEDMLRDYGGHLTWSAYEVTPDAPVVKITNVSASGKPKLTWNAVAGAEKYYVYRATSKTGTYKYLTSTTKTSLTNTSAVAGKTYYYKVRSVSSTGTKSSYSNVVSRTCDLARPSISVTNVASSGKLKISWDAIDGASKYYIYRSTSADGEFEYLTSTTKTSLTNTSAVAGKTYYYKVKAVHTNTNANSALSSASGKTCDLARPVVSIQLSSSGKPKLSWDAIDGAIKYYIYRSTSANGEFEYLTSTTKTSLTNTSAKSGVTYYYKVKAVHSNSNANSALSGAKSIVSK